MQLVTWKTHCHDHHDYDYHKLFDSDIYQLVVWETQYLHHEYIMMIIIIIISLTIIFFTMMAMMIIIASSLWSSWSSWSSSSSSSSLPSSSLSKSIVWNQKITSIKLMLWNVSWPIFLRKKKSLSNNIFCKSQMDHDIFLRI